MTHTENPRTPTGPHGRAPAPPGSPQSAPQASGGPEPARGATDAADGRAAALDRSRKHLVPVARLNLPDEPDLVHLSVLEWNPRLGEWMHGWAICGRSVEQGRLEGNWLITCRDCLSARPGYDKALAEQAQIAAERAAAPCPSRLVHPDAQWACDRPAGHPGGHSAGERGAVGYEAWTDQAAGANPVAGHRCPYCGHATTGQAFSGGREWHCPGCEVVEEYPDQRPAPPACPGRETAPNTCRCACEGCQHHCGAHQDDADDRGECGPECAEQHTYGPGCGAQIHNGQTDNEPVVDEAPAPPAVALRDQIAEALVALLIKKGYDPEDVDLDHGIYDRETGEVVDAVLPVVQAELDRRAALHADTERRLTDDLADEVQKREAADARLASVRGLAADLRGITGARHIADSLDKILAPKEPTP